MQLDSVLSTLGENSEMEVQREEEWARDKLDLQVTLTRITESSQKQLFEKEAQMDALSAALAHASEAHVELEERLERERKQSHVMRDEDERQWKDQLYTVQAQLEASLAALGYNSEDAVSREAAWESEKESLRTEHAEVTAQLKRDASDSQAQLDVAVASLGGNLEAERKKDLEYAREKAKLIKSMESQHKQNVGGIKVLQEELESLQREQIQMIHEHRHKEQTLDQQNQAMQSELQRLQQTLDGTVKQLGTVQCDLSHQKEVQAEKAIQFEQEKAKLEAAQKEASHQAKLEVEKTQIQLDAANRTLEAEKLAFEHRESELIQANKGLLLRMEKEKKPLADHVERKNGELAQLAKQLEESTYSLVVKEASWDKEKHNLEQQLKATEFKNKKDMAMMINSQKAIVKGLMTSVGELSTEFAHYQESHASPPAKVA